ncbi:hypothetical protein SprV_0301358400 [Sparganum proliferum]
MWRQGEVKKDFKDATIVHLYKRKGNRQICDNHRGISLLNVAGKIFARILLNRLNIHLEQGLLPESQCGFRRHRGTTDMIFAAPQLQEKCQEMRTHLYSTFVDLTKAFDTVNREGLWKIMQKFGCPERFIEMVRQLHDGMTARVTDNGAVSEAFALTNGVKQGCVLAVKTGAAIYEANRIAAAKVKRDARKSQVRPVCNADAQPLPTCSRCQRIGLVGHLRISCASGTASAIVAPPASSSSSPPPTNSGSSSEPPLSPSSSSSSSSSSSTSTTTTTSSSTPSSSSSSSSSSSTAPTTAAQAAVSHITNPDTTTDTTPTASDSSDEDRDYTCSHCDRTFTSHIGLVGHLRIHRTETGAPVPGAPIYTHQARLTCPHCPRPFRHRMGLFGHMRIHESGIDCSPETPTTSNTFTAPSPTLAPSPGAPITTTTTTDSAADDTETTDFTCPHCQRTFTSRIGLVGHLRIHRTETGAPVPGAPTYTHHARLNCPHCPPHFQTSHGPVRPHAHPR